MKNTSNTQMPTLRNLLQPIEQFRPLASTSQNAINMPMPTTPLTQIEMRPIPLNTLSCSSPQQIDQQQQLISASVAVAPRPTTPQAAQIMPTYGQTTATEQIMQQLPQPINHQQQQQQRQLIPTIINQQNAMPRIPPHVPSSSSLHFLQSSPPQINQQQQPQLTSFPSNTPRAQNAEQPTVPAAVLQQQHVVVPQSPQPMNQQQQSISTYTVTPTTSATSLAGITPQSNRRHSMVSQQQVMQQSPQHINQQQQQRQLISNNTVTSTPTTPRTQSEQQPTVRQAAISQQTVVQPQQKMIQPQVIAAKIVTDFMLYVIFL